MSLATASVNIGQLTLPEELLLMLLNEESGYFRQVPGWNLNCAVVGAALAELSLKGRIDTDLESLILLDRTETGDPALDPLLKEIADEPRQRNAQYWVERLAPHAEAIIDLTLERLVALKILEHHEGDFWTLANDAWKSGLFNESTGGDAPEFVRSRIGKVIFSNTIPDPRDVIIVCLVNTCDVLRFIFQIEEESEERIELICKMDVIGQSIANAVAQNIAGPALRRQRFTKPIPSVPLRDLVLNRHVRSGNIPALMGSIAEKHGPVFRMKLPGQGSAIWLAGAETNHWVNRHGRLHLRSRDYFSDFEKIYGASGLIPALDGADHFRIRKAMQPGYSRGTLLEQVDLLYLYARKFLANLRAGDSFSVTEMSREMTNEQVSPISVGIETQDIIGDLIKFKERALTTHIARALPKFMLYTPGMKRRARLIDEVVDRIQSVTTQAQREGATRSLADDLLSLHANDPQFLPESNLPFALSAPLLASMYCGDALAFAVYAMASHPELYARIREEADALFDGGDPKAEDFQPAAFDVTHRFLMECLRLYPVVPVSIRNVMNAATVEGFELPEGSRVFIAQTAAHYMGDVFPDPERFDIDRYLPPRNEHRSPGYAPYGLGTHSCLGFSWMELQVAINLLLLAHYFRFEPASPKAALTISPFPSQSPRKGLKLVVAEQRREISTPDLPI